MELGIEKEKNLTTDKMFFIIYQRLMTINDINIYIYINDHNGKSCSSG